MAEPEETPSEPEITQRDIDEACEAKYAETKQAMPNTLQGSRTWRAVFQQRLWARWGTAFDLYESILVTAHEAGSAFNKLHRSQAVKDKDLLFDALTKLYARACLTGGEILILLTTGYPTAAWGRWRTLHEITVVSLLIQKHGRDLAERYLLHEGIEAAKAATQYQEYHTRLGRPSLGAADLTHMAARRDALIQKFGADYGKEYGWATLVIGKPNPNLFDLEEALGLDHLRPFFRFASHGIHGGSRGTKLNVKEQRSTVRMVSGPSNADLAEPAHTSLLSLQYCTLALLNMRPELLTLDSVATMKTLVRLVEEAGTTFTEIEEELDREEEEITARLANEDPGSPKDDAS